MGFFVDCWKVLLLLQHFFADFDCLTVLLFFVKACHDVHHYRVFELPFHTVQSALWLICQVQANHAFHIELDCIIYVTIPIQLICSESLDCNPLILLIPVEALDRLVNMGVFVLALHRWLNLAVVHFFWLVLRIKLCNFQISRINIFF